MSILVDIEKKLGDFHLKVAFSGEEETLGLLGPSGCGKTLTLKCIAGIEKPDRGRIICNGVTLFDSEKHINLPPQQRKAGLLFQNYALFPDMTVEQNIEAGTAGERNKKKRRTMVERALADFELEQVRTQFPDQLSGGQQQRLALARLLVSEPGILLLDEPFSALDSQLRERMEDNLRQVIRRFEKTVILVTHDCGEAARMANTVVRMKAGHIEKYGTTSMEIPSLDTWLREAKTSEAGIESGMYLTHCGTVRRSSRAAVRQGAQTPPVSGMELSYDAGKLAEIVAATEQLPGIRHVRVWINSGLLQVGEDMMLALIGGDIRPHVMDAMDYLLNRIKTECVTEKELFDI